MCVLCMCVLCELCVLYVCVLCVCVCVCVLYVCVCVCVFLCVCVIMFGFALSYPVYSAHVSCGVAACAECRATQHTCRQVNHITETFFEGD